MHNPIAMYKLNTSKTKLQLNTTPITLKHPI